MKQPLVYVIVLSYNGRRWLEACFDTLLRTEYENYRVVLVDNASSDGSVELIRSRFPSVESLANNSNLGFSEGNNAGVRMALNGGADYVVLLNPDTKVEPEWLRELITVGEAEDTTGILGAVQLEYDGTGFNSWTTSAASRHLAELSDPARARRLIPMEWVEGACFAVKRRVWEDVGLLDPIYFAFYEEIDFCRRAICRGYEVALVPRSRVHHHRGGSWEAGDRIKRERDYRCDRSQFIYASTDPRRSLAGNCYWYLVTLATKLKALVSNFSLDRAVDLLKMQVELLFSAGAVAGKWRGDRSQLTRR
jgi:hypothetical protein